MRFFSDARQDEFVANLLNFKRDGYCLDIGSCHSIIANNTFAFVNLGWTSISVELDDKWNDSYSSTRNKGCHINEDALKVNYKKELEQLNFPKNIDYLSLDIDELSYDCLKLIPFNDYKFKVITIEHDAYVHGDKYRKLQRDFLTDLGYTLLCSDVYTGVEIEGFKGMDLPFEDWWVDANQIESQLIDKIKSDSLLPTEIIQKF